MGTKNNPDNRGVGAEGKQFNGQTVIPVLYIGTQVGHGRYISAQVEGGDMITDAHGKPLPWDAI